MIGESSWQVHNDIKKLYSHPTTIFTPDDLAQISTCANNHELMDAKVGRENDPDGDDADGKIEK